MKPLMKLLAFAVFAGVMMMSQWADAGGSPETTLVVVNGDSPVSLYIANEYVRMRDIPSSHIVWLHNIPSEGKISIKTFRQRIWKPIKKYISENDLDEEIDVITYSADFPYSVSFGSDIRNTDIQKNRYIGSVASLTGLTFFARSVEVKNTGYLKMNRYFRRDLSPRIRPERPVTDAEAGLFEHAKEAMKKKEYETAVELFLTFVRSYLWSSQAWYELARGYAALGKVDDAIAALSWAVDLGWSHSLSARTDTYLNRLNDHARFSVLLERMKTMKGTFQPAQGFRSHYAWTGSDNPVKDKTTDSLDRYYLSTLLAHTGVRGNSVHEVLAYLRAAALSDGTFPDGTVYLMENRNIRSVTREQYFHATVEALARRGRRAEILNKSQKGQNGIIPLKKEDVIGTVVGTRSFDWGASNSRLLPGAIAESLTSYGGYFDRASQTKLTEFLRHGASGSSGAVVEPFAIQAKFPVSYLHVHYADGGSLAEAFYQSIEAPYQLIIVGDPLARPFASFAEVSLEKPDIRQPWRDVVSLHPHIQGAEQPIDRIELWVDGHYVKNTTPGNIILWDTTTVEDGFHDVRLIAIEDSSIETRSSVRLPVIIANTQYTVRVDSVKQPVSLGADIRLSGMATHAQQVQIFQGVRLLNTAEVDQGTWEVSVPSEFLGQGPVSLFVRGLFPDGKTSRSKPIDILIEQAPASQSK
jgi:tetratricopeptide (TPR) repeat protein